MKPAGVHAICVCIATLASDALGAPRIDPYPAEWLDSSALLNARFGEVSFVARNGTPLRAFVYRATAFDQRNGPIFFVMHGAGRAARRYISAAAPLAERHDALAIAIEFSTRAYPEGEDYTLGITTRGEPDESVSVEKRWRERDSYVYSEVEHVFEAVRRSLGGSQNGYYIFGHSAGAQFVHRLLTFLTDARVLRAVAANAGWYTLPAPHIPLPYGLRGTPLEGVELSSLFRAQLTILLGEHDVAETDMDPLLRNTPAAMSQGATRLARGQNYFATGRTEAARIGAPFNWRLAVVPQATHEASEMMASAGLFLFESGEPCISTPAAAAGALTIDQILIDPPKGAAGDANADGVRDPSDDEFIKLVNTGHTPVCPTGWALGDANNPRRHVFPLETALMPGASLIVFGGGVPTGRFGGARIQWAFSGRLDLSNAGDVATLRDGQGALVKQVSWGDCAGQPCAADHRGGESHDH